MTVAALVGEGHTENMAIPFKGGSLFVAASALALYAAAAVSARADEIRLKDGKKLYGVIVAYENNMFKVKTDFGYVLVEKDKIASIVPSTPAGEPPKADKSDKTPATGKETPAPLKTEPAVASAVGTAAATNASVKSAEPAAVKGEKAAPKITNTAVKPEVPAATKTNAPPPNVATPGAPSNTLTASAQPPPPKAPEPPAIREEVQGNVYTNYTHGFKMYKAPSWELIEDARQAMPNAVVALGTNNQSTLLVIGQETTKLALEAAAATVEKRLTEIYENYRRLSQRKAVVGGLPAMEYHYSGMADGHEWSGTLTVIAKGNDIFTVLGMTYADSDLIQIQENVIARSIASLDFSVRPN